MTMQNENPTTPSLEDEFETLMALHLCKELDSAGALRLQALVAGSPDFKERYKNYTGMQHLMDRVPAGTLDELAEGRVIHVDFGSGDRSPGKSGRKLWIAVSVAAATLIAVGTALVINVLQKPSTRMLSFPHGKCSSGGKELRGGSSVGGDLESGSGSICDAQINEGGRVAVRIFPDSRISFDSRTDALHITLEKGRILLDAEKRSGQGLRIDAPGSSVAILGTKISVSRPDENRIAVDLLEGKAEIRTGPALLSQYVQKDVSDEALSQAAAVLPEIYAVQATVMEAGSSVEIQLREQANARAFFDGVDREAAGAKGDPKMKTLLLDMGKRAMAARPEFKTEIIDVRPAVKQEPMTDARRSEFDKWSEGMKAANGDANKTAESRQKPPDSTGRQPPGDPGAARPADSPKLKKQPSQAETGTKYRIRLKDGRVLLGRAEQEGDNYRVVTDAGEVVVPQSQVDAIEPQR